MTLSAAAEKTSKKGKILVPVSVDFGENEKNGADDTKKFSKLKKISRWRENVFLFHSHLFPFFLCGAGSTKRPFNAMDKQSDLQAGRSLH